MRRGIALLVAAAALAAPMAVASGDAAVSRSVVRLVEKRAYGQVPAATPARASAPKRARSSLTILEHAVVGRINAIRHSHGLRPLRLSRPLAVAADYHSTDMARRGYFEHDSASGTAFWRRIERFYPSRGFRSWVVGENLFWATETYGAAFAVREWMASPPHRENILDRRFTEIGIGLASGAPEPQRTDGAPWTYTTDFGGPPVG
jgi:uncharacterized protein YkwD